MKTLKEVQEFLSNIHFINCGGCGIAALSMYRWLKKNNKLNGKTKFAYFYCSDAKDDYLNNKMVLRDKKGEPVACSHAGILYRTNYIDCNDKIDVSEYDFIQHVSEEDFIIRSINNTGEWNTYFSRGNIPEIEKELNIDLSDIKTK